MSRFTTKKERRDKTSQSKFSRLYEDSEIVLSVIIWITVEEFRIGVTFGCHGITVNKGNRDKTSRSKFTVRSYSIIQFIESRISLVVEVVEPVQKRRNCRNNRAVIIAATIRS